MAHFALSKPDPSTGKTRLQTLYDIRTQTGITAPELAALPELPSGAEYIWGWFCALGERRNQGVEMNYISWPEIASFFWLMQVSPQRWEVEALVALDGAYMRNRASDSPTRVVTGAAALNSAVKTQKVE